VVVRPAGNLAANVESAHLRDRKAKARADAIDAALRFSVPLAPW
jgi:hypothetical protein